MTVRVEFQAAFVLHTRPFRDTSLIVDFFTHTHGKVSAVARAGRTQRSKFRGLLRAFVPLAISWSGKSELMSLSKAEPAGAPFDFSGKALISAIYLNELLEKLLAKFDPHPELYNHYQIALTQMQNRSADLAVLLRTFEKQLLIQLGYGIDWTHTADAGDPIIPDNWYIFHPEQGFIPVNTAQGNYLAFQGAHLIAIANDQWHDPAVMRSAKQLMRAAINPLLNGKPVRSRELFV